MIKDVFILPSPEKHKNECLDMDRGLYNGLCIIYESHK